MNLGGLEILDVVIGLVALFFLLSTALSSINEAIANVLGWRAKTLEDALVNLVGDPKVKKGLKSWLGGSIASTAKPADADRGPRAGHTDAVGPLADEGARPRPGLEAAAARQAVVPAAAGVLARPGRDDRGPGAGGQRADTEKSPWQQTDDEILARVKAAADELPDGS